MHDLSTEAATSLRKLVAGEEDIFTQPLADGEVRVVCEPLPARGVIGACRRGRTLWIIFDRDKPEARRHLADLIDHWPLDAAEELRLEEAVDLLPLPFGSAGGMPDGQPVVIERAS